MKGKNSHFNTFQKHVNHISKQTAFNKTPLRKYSLKLKQPHANYLTQTAPPKHPHSNTLTQTHSHPHLNPFHALTHRTLRTFSLRFWGGFHKTPLWTKIHTHTHTLTQTDTHMYTHIHTHTDTFHHRHTHTHTPTPTDTTLIDQG